MKKTLLIAAAMVGISAVPAMAFRSSQASKLKGTCIWQSVSYETTSGAAVSAGPVTTLAQLTFDGHGSLAIENYDVNNNGTFGSTTSIQGAYQVDSSGHGSFTYTSPISGRTLTFDFLLTPMHKAIKVMLQSDQNQPPLPRVASGECRFDE